VTTKYRYTVVQVGVVSAESKLDAEGAALAMVDGGFAETVAVEVEEVGEEQRDEHRNT
jgi:hypothetical protein